MKSRSAENRPRAIDRTPLVTRPGYLAELFGANAHTYERVNRIISLGMVGLWRRQLVKLLRLEPTARVLDAFAGPGSLAVITLGRLGPSGELVLVDLSQVMLRRARTRLREAAAKLESRRPGATAAVCAREVASPFDPGTAALTGAASGSQIPRNKGTGPAWVSFVRADLLTASRFTEPAPRTQEAVTNPPSLSLRAPFDAVLNGFALRYVPDPTAALRVLGGFLRPGGSLGVLEFTIPVGLARLHPAWIYFRLILPAVAGFLAGRRELYQHLRESTEDFLTPIELRDAVLAAGMENVRLRTHLGGLVSLVVARKP